MVQVGEVLLNNIKNVKFDDFNLTVNGRAILYLSILFLLFQLNHLHHTPRNAFVTHVSAPYIERPSNPKGYTYYLWELVQPV